MANEAVIIELLGNQGDPIRYTVADGTGIEKGTIMELTDPRTMQAMSAVDKPFCGIAAAEKVASDGSTTLAVYTNGIFDLTCAAGGTATLGQRVSSAAGDNTITVASTLDNEKGYTLGQALETGSNNEVIAVRVLL